MQAAAAHALREWYNTTSTIPTGYNSRRGPLAHRASRRAYSPPCYPLFFCHRHVLRWSAFSASRHYNHPFFRAPPLWWSPTFLIALLFLAPVMDMAGRQMRQRHDAKTRSGLFWGWDVLQVYTFCNIAFGLLARPGIRSEEGV